MSKSITRCIAVAAVLAAVIAANPAVVWSHDYQSAFIQRFDQDGDGLVSQDEFPGGQNQFQHLDIDGDGYLDAAEAPGQPPRRQPDPQEILADFDADGDGQLSVEEFPGPDAHFERLDSDGDGFLSPGELLAGQPGPPGGSGFERDDADQDGRVSRAEFSGPEGLFNRLDADGDGYITQAESEAAHRPGSPQKTSNSGSGQNS